MRSKIFKTNLNKEGGTIWTPWYSAFGSEGYMSTNIQISKSKNHIIYTDLIDIYRKTAYPKLLPVAHHHF